MLKHFEFSYAATSLISEADVLKSGAQLRPEIERIVAAQKNGYNSVYANIHVPSDTALLERVYALVRQKKELQPTALIVVGIGGSNLGTQAVLEALYGTYYNEQQPDMKVYFADTVDSDYIYDIILLMEQELEKGNTAIVAMISKSGATMETVANADIFIHLLKKYQLEAYYEYVVAITDEGSALWELAGEHHFARLAIPAQVGGRYSVFSAVGLFPLAMLGVDIAQLHAGAQSAIAACTTSDILNNPAALSAAFIAHNYAKGCVIHDTFVFSVDLERLGKWYRQLMGESIGKARKSDGKAIGITPTVSVGSTDLHSVAQLYLGGPHDKFTSFVAVEHLKSNVQVPKDPILHKLVASLGSKSLSSIMMAILKGVESAYMQQQRPFVAITIPEKSPAYIAQFMQFKMFEMIYLGYLLDVNPFDQPHVELYKDETRKMLNE